MGVTMAEGTDFETLRDWWLEPKKTSPRLLIVGFTYCAFMATAMLEWLPPLIHAALGVVFFVPVIIEIVRLIRMDREYYRMWDEFRDRYSCVPYWKHDLAIGFYGERDGQAAALECHEGHMDGDCPLCGAT